MAVTLTEILGTHSISGSRIVINDNFTILRDEINAIEVYLDPDAGTLDGLNSIQTLEDILLQCSKGSSEELLKAIDSDAYVK